MFVPIVTSGGEGGSGRSCGRGDIPREARLRFLAASLILAACILTVATIRAGGGLLPAGAATPVAILSVMIAGLLVNGGARQPGLPLVCATMVAGTLMAGAVFGIGGLTAPWVLGGLLFVPILVGTSSARRGAAILATAIIIAASLVAAMTTGPVA